jgi:hypothetical protein
MAPFSFIWVTEMFVSHVPTPAVWPKGGTVSSTGGPCLSPSAWLRIDSASWPALLRFASVRSNKARGRQWFWVLFPKEKACPEPSRRDLGCRAETRQYRKPCSHNNWWHQWDWLTWQNLFMAKPENRHPIHITKL